MLESRNRFVQVHGMICSGILIQTGGEDAIARLRPLMETEPRCTAGASAEGVLAAVLEFSDSGEAHNLHDWLLALPGVESVHVASIQYDGGGRLP